MLLTDLYADVAAVLRSTEPGRAVLDSVLLPHNSRDVPVADVLSAPCETSLGAKLADPAPADPNELLHDLQLAFGRLIAQFPQDAPEYEEVSQLFKFVADLLAREAHRHGLAPLGAPETDEHLLQLSHGFQRTSTELLDFNRETFWTTAANGPLFMSATNKAPVDPRDTAVAGSVHTVKLLPHVARAPETTLGAAAPPNPLLPPPYAAPSSLTDQFVHPNVHTTVPPLWLEGADSYATFAPTIDSAGAVIGGDDATQVWLERAGGSTSSTDNAPADADASQDDTNTLKSTPDAPKDNFNDATSPEITTNIANGSTHAASPGGELTPNELATILRWSPYSFVDDDEVRASETGEEPALAAELLLQLQEQQRARFAASANNQDISDAERRLALKASNVLTRLVASAHAEDCNLELDPRLPVLMRNYAGTLPAATDPALQPVPREQFGGGRLSTLAGLRQRSRR